MNVYPYSKGGSDIQVQALLQLNVGEVISSINVGAVTPTSSTVPTLTVNSGIANPMTMTITGGIAGVTYGFPVTVVTNDRTFVVTVAVSVQSDAFAPYPSSDPYSYQDLVGFIQAGATALAKTGIPFPAGFDPSGGFVTWDILDTEGTVYASGNAFDYRIMATGVSNTVIARSLINIPSSIPQSEDPYQIRYTLNIGDNLFYQFEAITVTPLVTVELGAVDTMEMQGDPATVTLVTEQLYTNYELELWSDGMRLATMVCGNAERVSSGYCVGGVIDTSALPASCEPYKIIWKYYNTPSQPFRDRASLWIVTDSMVQAIDDVKSKVNKARQTIYGTPDSQYPSTEIMKWLRRGMDAFNGAYGQFTNFTMTNAKGVVREYWLLYAEKAALEAQYLMEGEKAFNFSGASISLEVDRTQYLDNAAGKIQQQLDSEVKLIKTNLIIKGNTGGDGSGPGGSGNFGALQRGAMGSVSITITPAMIYNQGWGGYWGRNC